MRGDARRKAEPGGHTLQNGVREAKATRPATDGRAILHIHARYYGGTSWLADAARHGNRNRSDAVAAAPRDTPLDRVRRRRHS